MADGGGPKGRADVRIVRAGDEGMLYDPVAVRAHRVNATAIVVWGCCDGTASVADISAELADAFGESLGAVTDSVREVVDRFAAAGLLEGVAGVPRRPSDPPGPIASDGSLPTAAPLRRLGPYAALDLRVSIDCHDSHAVADEIERALGSLATVAPDTSATDEVTLTVWTDGNGGWNLDTDGSRLNAQDESAVSDYVLWQITHLAIDRSPRYLVVHASAVARDGVAVVFPAEADSGKSTLATILVEAGFDYLTDEATAIDLDTGEVVAYPKPITLDPGSQLLLAHLDPGGLAGSSERWRIAPSDIRRGFGCRTCDPDAPRVPDPRARRRQHPGSRRHDRCCCRVGLRCVQSGRARRPPRRSRAAGRTMHETLPATRRCQWPACGRVVAVLIMGGAVEGERTVLGGESMPAWSAASGYRRDRRERRTRRPRRVAGRRQPRAAWRPTRRCRRRDGADGHRRGDRVRRSTSGAGPAR